MRWLFLLMLALNLAYIAWQTTVPAPGAGRVVPPLADVPAILLLSEVSPDKSSGPADAASLVPQPVVDSVPAAAPDEVLQPAAAVAKQTEDVIVASAPDTGEQVAAASAVAAVTLPVVAGERCYTLGPFRDLEVLRGLIREIRSYVVTADFRGQEQKEPPLHWVYLKPQQSRAKAIALGERLKENKVKDFYIIREGEHVNGVSLGYFKSRESAAGLAKKVSKMGFEVQLEPVFRSFTEYWLDYRLADSVTIPAAIFDKHIPPGETDDIGSLSRDCNS